MAYAIFKKEHIIPVFWCLNCDFSTSGSIQQDKDPNRKYCHSCGCILVWCPNCHEYLSAIEEDGEILCGNCRTEIPSQHVDFNVQED